MYDWFYKLLGKYPFLAVLVPSGGAASTYIPDITDKPSNDSFLILLEPIIPYIRVFLLIATVVTTILAIIIQIRKLIKE